MKTNTLLFEKTYSKDAIHAMSGSILEALLQCADPVYPAVLLFYGDLGYGKTTLIKAIGEILGVAEQITSPTFGIMRFYDTSNTVFKKFIHIDAYRLEEEKDVQLLNLKELLSNGENTLIAIEWPSQITSALPTKTFSIILSNHNCNSEDERHIQLVKNF